MMTVERMPFQGTLPDIFFSMTTSSDEDPAFVQNLFWLEADRNETILYTAATVLRLVGIFPQDSDEAYFGFWETANDATLNQHAFALLEVDARQRSRTILIGPVQFNTFQRYRLRLTEAPSWGRFDREPVNPAYYPSLLTQMGFRVRSRFESRLIRHQAIPDAYEDKRNLLAELAQIPFDYIPLNPETWQRYEDELFTLVHQVFSANPAYRPVSSAQFNLLYNRRFAEALCPYSSVLFRDQQTGQLVALSFCHPNYQSLALPAGESPAFIRDFPRLDKKTLLVRSVGVHPDFRQRGLMSFLGAYGMMRFRDLYDEVIFCLMRTDNFSLHFSDGMPRETAQYALFEKELRGSPELL